MRRRSQVGVRPVRYALLTAGLLLTAACAPIGPDFVRPDVRVNPEWLQSDLEEFATDSAELAQWWKVLEDPVLDSLIETAHRQNNSLRIAGLRVLEARASLDVATGSRYPQAQVVAGDATALRASESNANTGAGDLSFTQYNLGVGLSWELDFWGRFRRSIEAADAGLSASVAGFDETLVLLTAQVADVYALIRAGEEQLRLARESLAIQQRSYEIVDVLYRNGASSELDALQARTLLLSTEAAIPSLEASLRQAKNAMSVLLGMAPSDIDGLLHGEGDLPAIAESIAVGVPANLLRQRPDVRRAEQSALAQNALVGVAEANLYPSFSISGSLGLAASGSTDTTRTGDSGLGELFRGESLTYAVGPSFVWPFLNYGRIRSNIRVQDARLQQALVQYRETVIQAAREVEDAMAGFSGARAQDRILRETVATARRSADLSMLRYQEGFADYQRVVSAQQALFTQQQRFAANRGNVVRGLIAIYRSLGGGWQTPYSVDYIDADTQREMTERTDWGDLLEGGAGSSSGETNSND